MRHCYKWCYKCWAGEVQHCCPKQCWPVGVLLLDVDGSGHYCLQSSAASADGQDHESKAQQPVPHHKSAAVAQIEGTVPAQHASKHSLEVEPRCQGLQGRLDSQVELSVGPPLSHDDPGYGAACHVGLKSL